MVRTTGRLKKSFVSTESGTNYWKVLLSWSSSWGAGGVQVTHGVLVVGLGPGACHSCQVDFLGPCTGTWPPQLGASVLATWTDTHTVKERVRTLSHHTTPHHTTSTTERLFCSRWPPAKESRWRAGFSSRWKLTAPAAAMRSAAGIARSRHGIVTSK